MNIILCDRNKGWGSKSLEKYLGKGDIMNIMGTHRIPILGTEDVGHMVEHLSSMNRVLG